MRKRREIWGFELNLAWNLEVFVNFGVSSVEFCEFSTQKFKKFTQIFLKIALFC